MDKNLIKDRINLMQAYLDGKEIQWKDKRFPFNDWHIATDPQFNFQFFEYRIKPKPLVIKYRRYIFKDSYGFAIFNHQEDSNEPTESIEEMYGFYKWLDSDWITEEINV